MASANFKNLRGILDRIKESLSEISERTFLEIGQYVAARIVMKARTGKTMVSGEAKNLKPLSPKYIEQRQRWKKSVGEHMKRGRKDKRLGFKQDDFNHGGKGWNWAVGQARSEGMPDLDSEFFAPARSNLTVTGQYLNSIRTTKIDKRNRTVAIGATGTRKDGLENEKLAGYLADGGRNIYDVDQTGRKVIKQMVLREIRNLLKKKLLRK